MKKLKPEQIASWVKSNFPDHKERKGGAEIRIHNPFAEDTGYHLNISIDKALCHDWRGDDWVGISAATGKRKKCTFLKFVQLHLNCSFFEALRNVLGASSDPRLFLRTQKASEDEESTEDSLLSLPEGTESLLDSSQPKMASGILKWLAGRGIDKRRIEKYNMLHNGLAVVWPYYEYDELVYWQIRSRVNKEFLFPPESVGVIKTDFLYGFDQVEPASHIIITESIIDSQTVEEQCVATGGASLGPKQVRKVRALGPRDGIILAPDNDLAGLQSVLHNATLLRPLQMKLFVSIPPAIEYINDYGELSFTTDWNEVGRYGVGWDKVLDELNNNTRELTMRVKKDLLAKIGKLASKSITAEPFKC